MGTVIVAAILGVAVVLALVFSRKRAGGCGCCDGCGNKNCGKHRD